MKNCNVCHKVKEYGFFFKDKQRLDGYLPRCKDCDREYTRKKRVDNSSSYKEKDKRYYLLNKEKIILRRKEWYLKNRDKALAHQKVKLGIKRGLLTKKPCEVCGDPKSVGHHEDYLKPLEVKWLCSRHHMRLHHGK